jgi:hypothetical protein
MSEAALIGALGFVFVGAGVIALAAALGGLIGAAIACIVVGIGLGIVSTL